MMFCTSATKRYIPKPAPWNTVCPDETERALCQTLKSPAKCPDDQQEIPACDLEFDSCEKCVKWAGDNLDEVGKRKSNIVSVASLKEKQEAKVAFIRGDHKSLKRLQDMGLTPGTKIRVNRIAPMKGPGGNITARL